MADDVPAFDDIPSFDDLPDAPAPQASAGGGVPAFDDIPDFDHLPDQQGPTAEGPAATFARAAAHGVVPGAGALVGMGAGAAAGAPFGGWGAIPGAIVGGILGAAGADVVQNKVLDAVGMDDSVQMALDADANPNAALGGEIAGSMVGMSPEAAGATAGKRLLTRAVGGAFGGGVQAAQDYVQNGSVDPKRAIAGAVAGAALPGTNRFGSKLVAAGERMIPGRPNRTANPEADASHVDVMDQSVETAVGDSALAESPPIPRTGETTGNPQSAPERSDRVYPKDNATVAPESDMLTQGQFDPATSAAIDAANPAPAPAPAPAPPQQRPLGMPPENFTPQNPRINLKRTSPAPAPEPKPVSEPAPSAPAEMAPSVETGIPQVGEPVATGENDATAMPQREMPEIKGTTPKNDTISDAQKAAGNYKKARTHDFGKPMAIETHEGDVRRAPADAPVQWENKSPADYGYFNKTLGKDKDQIDFYRPSEDNPDRGDKHFIIDQSDADTGKFDEHKVMTYYKDIDAAREAYLRAFSDDKALARLHDITEVDRPTLSKWLAKPGRKTQAFGAAYPKETKPVAERAVVKDAIAKFEAKGDTEKADMLRNAPDSALEALAGKRTRKYGVETGSSAGYPVEGLVNAEGNPVTANTKTKAAERAAAHKQMVDWYDKTAPKKQNETSGETLDRLRSESNPFVGRGAGWVPAFKPREWMLAAEARKALTKPTPANVKKYLDAERLLRGSKEDVDTYRGGNRVDADVAMNRRGGDEAISNAEAAGHNPGTNDVEDAAIAAIDAKRKPKFDIPHEEAEAMVPRKPVKTKADLKELPKKTIDVGESNLAIDTKAISKEAISAAERRKAEAAALVKKKAEANKPSEDLRAGEGRSLIKTADPKELQAYIDKMNKLATKEKGLDALPAEREPMRNGGIKDLLGDFVNDERGSLDLQKVRDDIRDALKRTEHKSYLAKKSSGPLDDYVRSVGEELHRINQEDRNHSIGLLKRADKMPFTEDEREKIFRARDADSAAVDLPGKQAGKTNIESMPQDLLDKYNEHLKPILDINDAAAATIRAGWPDRIGADVEHHMSHIQKGDTSKYNLLRSKDDPTGPAYGHGIRVNASAAKERHFMALERVGDGKRFVIQDRPNGFTIHENYKATPIKDPAFEFEANKPYTVEVMKNGKPTGQKVDYIMRNAMAEEIEKNARGLDGKGKPMKYYKDAGFAGAVTNAQLGSMARHLVELERLKQTPEFKQYATRNRKTGEDRGWQESNLPNMHGWLMHPDLKAAFDDFAGHPQSMWRDLNAKITKMLFWMPTAHIANVGAHWFVGRGWDNLSVPKWYKMSVDTLPKAIKSVVNQDEYQDRMRSAGAGSIYGSILTNDMLGQLAKRFQQDIERAPSAWSPIATKLGMKVSDLGTAIYHASSKVMWAANDVFLTQRIMELENRGMSMKQAIIEAERDIPNYRVPIKVLNSRAIAEKVGDPAWLSFGRYHFGMVNSYAGIVKDAIGKDATLGDRVDGAGKLMALGLLGMIIYPAMDKMAKMVTGNDDATQQRRGPMSIPHQLNEARLGHTDIMAALRTTMTMTPAMSTAIETVFNKDFRGKPIVQPDDVTKGSQGHPQAIGRALISEGEHAARGLVSPLSTLENAVAKTKPGDNAAMAPARAVRDQAFDVKNPSQKAVKWEKQSQIKNFRDANTRYKQGGAGFIEGAYNKLVGK